MGSRHQHRIKYILGPRPNILPYPHPADPPAARFVLICRCMACAEAVVQGPDAVMTSWQPFHREGVRG